MKLGIGTYTYTWAIGVPDNMPGIPMNPFEILEIAEKHKLQCIQIADNYPLDKLPTSVLEQLRVDSVNKNIQIEVGSRFMNRENLSLYIMIAKFFSSPFLRFVIDGPGFQPTVNEIIVIIKNALDELREYNMILAIENHDRLKSYDFARIVEVTDPKWVGICLDSVNSMGASEGIEEVVRTLAPYTVNLHVKDYSIRRVSHKMGFVIEGTPAGKGMLNVPWLIEKLAPYNHCVSAILELWTPPENDLNETITKERKWAEDSIAYLKRHIV